MPFARPTLTTLRTQAQQDINASGLAVNGFLQKAVLRVLALVQAGFAYLHYGYLDFIAKQAVPATSTDEYAQSWGALIGVNPKIATQATGTWTSTGTNGTVLGSGAAITRADGTQYTTTASATVAMGVISAPIIATVAAAAGNAVTGTPLTLTNPVVGINASGSASGAVTGGSDIEDTNTAYKTRMLAAYAAPPQGGDRADYITWATAVAGVTRAWVTPAGNGPGTVQVYTMFDISEAAFGGFPQGTNGVATNETRDTPATGDQLAVANYIFTFEPLPALVYSLAPVATPVAFTVADLGANNTPAMQASISAALTSMLVRIANVGGTVNPQTGAAWPPLEPSDVVTALAAIPGLTKFKVTVPAAALTPTIGQLFTVGTITYVT